MPTMNYMIETLTKEFNLTQQQIDQLYGMDKYSVYKLYIANCSDMTDLD